MFPCLLCELSVSGMSSVLANMCQVEFLCDYFLERGRRWCVQRKQSGPSAIHVASVASESDGLALVM